MSTSKIVILYAGKNTNLNVVTLSHPLEVIIDTLDLRGLTLCYTVLSPLLRSNHFHLAIGEGQTANLPNGDTLRLDIEASLDVR